LIRVRVGLGLHTQNGATPEEDCDIAR
jgi:hypothetical protein